MEKGKKKQFSQGYTENSFLICLKCFSSLFLTGECHSSV